MEKKKNVIIRPVNMKPYLESDKLIYRFSSYEVKDLKTQQEFDDLFAKCIERAEMPKHMHWSSVDLRRFRDINE